jgi:putative hydrolase of the HAD superfamily
MRNTRIGPASTILFDAGNTLAFLDLDRVGRALAGAGWAVDAAALAPAEQAARAAMYRAATTDPTLTDRGRWGRYMGAFASALGLPRGDGGERMGALLEDEHRRDNLWRRVEEGTETVLDRLAARGFRLGVVSNADGRVRALLADLGLARFFEVIVDSHEVGVEKPDPRIFDVALAHLGERAERAVYVGDFPQVDVVGARRAGIRPVLLDPLGLAEDADCPVIASLGELPALLDDPSPPPAVSAG